MSEDRTLTPANQLVLSHELRHAMQDQYADVHRIVPDEVGDFDDRRLAFVSLLEGDARKAQKQFGWKYGRTFKSLVEEMVDWDLRRYHGKQRD